ncbi:hypothetical protein [Trinickia symbiotica]|uniref:hypothetical protein n=1 Tax=Trinickia symbiotica TaxID=863227 RepID=UPI00068661CB|nr:hypothetical protein [Trinickia symbiotica]
MLTLTLIKRLMENPWVFHSTAMGYPFGSTIYDYPIPDSGSLAALKLFALATGNAGAAFNFYYLIGFPIDAVAAYAIFRCLQISRPLSTAGAFAFAILPFHFLRLYHLFYTWYFPAPCFIWFSLRIFSGELDFFHIGQRVGRTLIAIASLTALTCFGVYYACFGVIAIVTAGAARCLQTRSVRAAWTPIVAAAVVTLGVGLNVAPSIGYRVAAGVNQEAIQRSPAESEIEGLKIVQLLLPRRTHRFEPFAALTSSYSSAFPLVNENSTASLGVLGSAGFLSLLAAFLAPGFSTRRQQQFYALAIITLGLLLFCTIGGFSCLFSLLISPLIRSWNRVSVFIAFTSICAALVLIDSWLRRRRNGVVGAAVISAALVAIAIWDQTVPACDGCNDANSSEFRNDEDFVSKIEELLPPGSGVLSASVSSIPRTGRNRNEALHLWRLHCGAYAAL